MDKEQKDTLLKVGDNSHQKEKILIWKINGIIISGILAWGISLKLMLLMADVIYGIEFLIACEVVSILLYSCGMFCVKVNRTTSGYLSSLIGALIALIASNIALLLIYFRSGSYYNYGMISAGYNILVFLISFGAAGVITSIINGRKGGK